MAEARHELQDADEGVGRGADDVRDEREREAGEAVVGRDDGRPAGELDQPQRPGDSGTALSMNSATGTGQLPLLGAHRVTGCATDRGRRVDGLGRCVR